MDAGLTEEGMGAPFQPSSATLPKLRDELRRRGLSTLGRKADLIERLVAAILADSTSGATAAPAAAAVTAAPAAAAATAAPAAAAATAAPASAPVASKWGGRGELGRTEQLATAAAVASAAARAPPPSGAGAAAPALSRPYRSPAAAAGGGESSLKQADEAETLLQESVRAFLLEQGGVASSRNVGRHLASRGQLAKLKQQFSGLFHFLQRNDQLFRIVLPSDDKGPQMLEYQVGLVDSKAQVPTEPRPK